MSGVVFTLIVLGIVLPIKELVTMRKIAILGDLLTLDKELQTTQSELLGKKLAEKSINLVFENLNNIESVLCASYFRNGGKYIFVTPSNLKVSDNRCETVLTANGELSEIDLIYSNSDEFFFFPGGPDILARLSYFWVKNISTGKPKNIYLIGKVWRTVIESLETNEILSEMELKNTAILDTSELIDVVMSNE
jgi:hypothetical protein